MNIPGLITPRAAQGAITKRRIVKTGNANGTAVQASAATAALLGVSTDIDAATGEVVDVVRSGLTPVEYGGTVPDGALLTADSQGRAIAVTLPVAANTYTIGYAEVAGVVGDIGFINVVPGFVPA